MFILSYNRRCFKGLKGGYLLVLSCAILLFHRGILSANTKWPHLEFSINARTLEDDRCYKCHLQKTQVYILQDPFKNLRPEYEDNCLKCHKKIPKICQMIVMPETYKILFDQIPSFPLPLINGKITCASCHYNHLNSQDKRLREEFSTLKKLAEDLINPHKTGAFCFLCHEKEPAESQVYLKSGNDITGLCRQCHNNKRARTDNHPVGIKPSDGITIPAGFPLKDGRMTCITCHQLKCQGTTNNPYLLRGGPYAQRTDTCMTCHSKEKYKKDNPHELVYINGNIKQDKCMICHSLETSEKGEKIFGFKFKAPFILYCVGCHPVEVQRHPFGAYHTGRFVESIWAGMSLSERLKIAYEQSFKITPVSLSGQLMCTTCHNPHDPRPGPKLRISDINLSCRQCHYRHYGKDYSSGRSYNFPFYQPTKEDLEPKGDDVYSFGYRASIRFYCIGCHANKDIKHPYGIDHNGKFITAFWKYLPFEKRLELSQAETLKSLPLTTNGQIACFTCHDPHDARKGRKLRLEDRTILCTLCHIDRTYVIEKYKKEHPEESENLEKEREIEANEKGQDVEDREDMKTHAKEEGQENQLNRANLEKEGRLGDEED